ncbi:hypothetical protein Dimus_003698, partial [Dionaea muscipula]
RERGLDDYLVPIRRNVADYYRFTHSPPSEHNAKPPGSLPEHSATSSSPSPPRCCSILSRCSARCCSA